TKRERSLACTCCSTPCCSRYRPESASVCVARGPKPRPRFVPSRPCWRDERKSKTHECTTVSRSRGRLAAPRAILFHRRIAGPQDRRRGGTPAGEGVLRPPLVRRALGHRVAVDLIDRDDPRH